MILTLKLKLSKDYADLMHVQICIQFHLLYHLKFHFLVGDPLYPGANNDLYPILLIKSLITINTSARKINVKDEESDTSKS